MLPRATFIPPAIPVAGKDIPSGDGYVFEPKLDGWRCIVVKNDREVRFYSRKRTELTPRLPILMDTVAQLRVTRLVLDCELVALDAAGAVDFYGLPTAMRKHPERLQLYAFDILMHGKTNLSRLPLRERQKRLDALMERANLDALHTIARHHDGHALFKACEAHGHEGIIAKRLDLPYASGRCASWIKIKTEAWRTANKDRWRRFAR